MPPSAAAEIGWCEKSKANFSHLKAQPYE